MMSLNVRKITSQEAQRASEIEQECLETAWSPAQIAALPENAFYLAAFLDGEMCGIGSIYCVFGEGQIMNIAVSEKFRNRGIATEILKSLIETAVNDNCENITLEVAENNISAISLYEKSGFCAVGRRKGFYHGVDALIMEKKL